MIRFTNGEIKKNVYSKLFLLLHQCRTLGHIDNTSAELLTRYMGRVSSASTVLVETALTLSISNVSSFIISLDLIYSIFLIMEMSVLGGVLKLFR